MYSFSYLEPVCRSMSISNCCFLICIQISQEAGKVVWYSCSFKNVPQFVVIHIVKGFGVVNKAEIDAFSGTLLLFWWSKRPVLFSLYNFIFNAYLRLKSNLEKATKWSFWLVSSCPTPIFLSFFVNFDSSVYQYLFIVLLIFGFCSFYQHCFCN